MFNHHEIRYLGVLKTARSFDTYFVQIGCVVSEIMEFHNFYILIHNKVTVPL